jgi:hypothetical protein
MIRLDVKSVIVGMLMAVAAILTTMLSDCYSDSLTLLDSTILQITGMYLFRFQCAN